MKTAQMFFEDYVASSKKCNLIKPDFQHVRVFFSFGELVLSCCVEYFGQKFLFGVGRAM